MARGRQRKGRTASPMTRSTMQKTKADNAVALNYPIPKIMCESSAKGLRREITPKPPKERLMSTKMGSLLRDFDLGGKCWPRGGEWERMVGSWVDRVARGRQKRPQAETTR